MSCSLVVSGGDLSTFERKIYQLHMSINLLLEKSYCVISIQRTMDVSSIESNPITVTWKNTVVAAPSLKVTMINKKKFNKRTQKKMFHYLFGRSHLVISFLILRKDIRKHQTLSTFHSFKLRQIVVVKNPQAKRNLN